MKHVLAIALLVATGVASGQGTTSNVAGSGFVPPSVPLTIPGELFTLFVTGLDPDLKRPFFAQSPPLPFEVNGLTVVSSHAVASSSGEPSTWKDYATAIHSIRQAGELTAITVQIPPEIERGQLPNSSSPFLFGPANGAIRIWNGDTVVATSDLMLWASRIRVVTTCDFSYEANQNQVTLQGVSSCPPVFFREDGSPASGNIVYQKEKLKILISGGVPPIRELFRSGWPNPDPPVNSGSTYLRDIGINLGPRRPWRNKTTSGPQPPMLFAPGIHLPGEYGISMIEIEMPEIRQGVDPPCPSDLAYYRSNVTFTIGDTTSFDHVQFCVMGSTAPPTGADQNLRAGPQGGRK